MPFLGSHTLSWPCTVTTDHSALDALQAVSLPTEENHTYYEIMLEDLLPSYSPVHGRKLGCFFLDVACKFHHAMDRWAACMHTQHTMLMMKSMHARNAPCA